MGEKAHWSGCVPEGMNDDYVVGAHFKPWKRSKLAELAARKARAEGIAPCSGKGRPARKIRNGKIAIQSAGKGCRGKAAKE